MAVIPRLSEEEKALHEVLRHPLFSADFLRNLDIPEDGDSWEHTDYQQEIICDFNNHVCLCSGRAIGKCLHKDARVLNPVTGEYRTVEEWYRLQSLHRIVSIDENTFKQEIGKPIITDNGYKPIVEIVTTKGFSTKVTREHPFLTNHGWKEANDLELGDYIAVPNELSYFGNKEIDELDLIYLAHFIAGGIYKWGAICTTESEVIEEVYKFANANNMTVYTDDCKYHFKGTYRLDLLERYGLRYCHSYDKFIPQEIFELSKNQIGIFLNRLFGDDGWCYINDKAYEIGYATTSEQLAKDIKHLLLRFGIIPSVGFKENNHGGSWWISIKGINNCIKFYKYIGFTVKRKQDALEEIIRSNISENHNTSDIIPIPNYKDYHIKNPTQRPLRYHPTRLKAESVIDKDDEFNKWLNADIRWVKISDIIYRGKEQTYNIEVSDYHTLVADDIYSHNSETILDKTSWLLINNFFKEDPVAITTPNRVHLEPLFSKLRRWLSTHSFLKHYVSRQGMNSSLFNIRAKNGFTLDCRIAGTSGGGANVIGLHTPIIMLDEAGVYPWGTWIELLPTWNSWQDGSQIFVSGVPTGQRDRNVLYYADREDPNFVQHRIPQHRNPRYSEEDEKRNRAQFGGQQSEDYIHLVCFTPETLVYTESGLKEICEIRKGEKVLTHKGRWKEVLDTHKLKYSGDLIEIETQKSLNPIRCTPKHKLYGTKLKKVTWGGNSPYAIWKGNSNKRFYPEFLSAHEYSKLDRLASPKVDFKKSLPDYIYFSEFGEVVDNYVYIKSDKRDRLYGNGFPYRLEITDDLLFFLGLFIAEGSNVEDRGQIAITLNRNEDALTNHCENIIENTFKLSFNRVDLVGEGIQIRFNSKIFSEFVSKYIGHGAKNKRVPEFLLGVNSELLKPFINGLFSGDGSIREKEGRPVASYSSISKELILQLYYILTGFGIKPCLYKQEKRDVHIFDYEHVTTAQDSYHLELNHHEVRKVHLGEEYTWDDFHNGDLSTRIKSKKKIPYDGYVYDLSVEDDSSYVIEQCSVHNCGKHGSPVYSLFDRHKMQIESYDVFVSKIYGDKVRKNPLLLKDLLRIMPNPPKKGELVFGIDLGYTESTVISILKKNEHVWKYFARLELVQVNYNLQQQLIADLDLKYNPLFVGIDSGGPGKVVVQNLINDNRYDSHGFPEKVVPVDFNTTIHVGYDQKGNELKERSKVFGMQKLQEMANNHSIVFSSADMDVVTELEKTVYSRTPSGNIVYTTLTDRGGKRGDDHTLASLLAFTLAWYFKYDAHLIKRRKKKLWTPRWV